MIEMSNFLIEENKIEREREKHKPLTANNINVLMLLYACTCMY